MSSQPSSAVTDGRRPNGKTDAGIARDFVSVARGADLVVIRVVGKGNMITAPALSDFIEEQRKAGFKRFVFDLERCTGLDSTFMGVMVSMHASKNSETGRHAPVVDVASDKDLIPMTPAEAAAALKQTLNKDTSESETSTTSSAVLSAVNVNNDVKALMSMLGVDKFVKIRGTCDLKQLETTMLAERQVSSDERRRLILKAHENLVEIDKRNEAQFGPFLKTLSMELAKE